MDHLREVIRAGHDSTDQPADEKIKMPDRPSIRSLRHTSEDISVAPLMGIALLLQERGLDASTVLERIGVGPRVFDDAANRLPFDVVGRLVAECAAATACQHFGLLLGKRSGASALGAVAGFARHADTVGAGLLMLLAHPEARVRLAALADELSAAAPVSAREAVIRALSCMIIAIPPSSEILAQVLGMKPRRLRKRLEAEGTSVKPGAFSRAFREWSGKTPRQWRQGA
jgi:5,10-methenyltetrahydromethanopterin hydrogenase